MSEIQTQESKKSEFSSFIQARADKIVEELAPEIKSNNSGGAIFLLRYKRGPVMREINFRAANMGAAQVVAGRYIQHIKAQTMEKIVQIGKVEYFAKDLDEEIARDKRRLAING